MDVSYSTINIYNSLKSKYPNYLKPNLISVLMVLSSDTVWLETVETELLEDGLEKHTTKRIDLGFISEGNEPNEMVFNPKDTLENNARKFIYEFSPYSIINTTELFTDSASEKISKKYNTFGVDR